MMILFYISLILFCSYLGYVIYKYNIPQSISESSYLLGLKGGNIWFYGWLVLTVFTLMPFWFEITKDTNIQYLIFLACGGLLGVSVTGRFRNDKHENKVHLYSAYGCALAATLWSILTFNWFWVVALIVFPLMFLLGKKIKGSQRNLVTNTVERKNDSTIFWLEIGCFLLCYISIYIYHSNVY